MAGVLFSVSYVTENGHEKKCAAAYQKFAYLEKQLNQNLFVLSLPAKW